MKRIGERDARGEGASIASTVQMYFLVGGFGRCGAVGERGDGAARGSE